MKLVGTDKLTLWKILGLPAATRAKRDGSPFEELEGVIHV
jgi:hypothetical protein